VQAKLDNFGIQHYTKLCAWCVLKMEILSIINGNSKDELKTKRQRNIIQRHDAAHCTKIYTNLYSNHHDQASTYVQQELTIVSITFTYTVNIRRKLPSSSLMERTSTTWTFLMLFVCFLVGCLIVEANIVDGFGRRRQYYDCCRHE
jgi:hypothetical protein